MVADYQSLDPSFRDPQLRLESYGFYDRGAIWQPDGKLIIFGHRWDYIDHRWTGPFTRLNRDGSVDQTWIPQWAQRQYQVNDAALQADSKIVVASYSRSFADANGGNLSRLLPDGTPDSSFTNGLPPGTSANYVTVQRNGFILVSDFGSQATPGSSDPRQGSLWRLDSSGHIDPSFRPPLLAGGVVPGFSSSYLTAKPLVDPFDRIIIAGIFSSVNGQPRAGLARLLPDGSLDETFVPSNYTLTNGFFSILASQSNGKIIAFKPQQSAIQQGLIMRFDTNGVADTDFSDRFATFTPISAVTVLSDDRVLVSGFNDNFIFLGLARFSSDGDFEKAYPYYWSRLDGSGTLPTGFSPGPNGQVVVLGFFDYSGGETHHALARLDNDGNLDSNFVTGEFESEAAILQMETAPDDALLVTSNAQTLREKIVARQGSSLLALDASGGFLAGFDNINFLSGYDNVSSFAPAEGGTIFVSHGGLVSRQRADGSLDPGYAFSTPDLSIVKGSGSVQLTLQPDGKLLIDPFGAANQFNISSLEAIEILSGTNLLWRTLQGGGVDTSFQLDRTLKMVERAADQSVQMIHMLSPHVLAVQPDGRILYSITDNTNNHRVVRLNPDGSLDRSFATGTAHIWALQLQTNTLYIPVPADIDGTPVTLPYVSSTPKSVGFMAAKVEQDGHIVIAGQFLDYGGTPRHGLVRLNADGLIDEQFAAGGGAGWSNRFVPASIDAVVPLLGGGWMAGGFFDSFGSLPRPGLALLDATGEAIPDWISPLQIVAGESRVSLAVLSTGDLIAAGSFISAADGGLHSLARLAMVDRPFVAIGKLTPPNGESLGISITGVAGARVRLEISDDLIGWTPFLTNILAPASITVPAEDARKYFRAVVP